MRTGQRQLEKDFEELYVGQNRELLVENYYKKKRKDFMLLTVAGVALLVILAIEELLQSGLPTGKTIARNEYGEGKKQVELQVRREKEEWEDVSLTLFEREYTKEEIEQYFEAMIQELPQRILGQNESLEQVCYDLDLKQEIEGYPLLLYWESSRPDLLDSFGTIHREETHFTDHKKEELIELRVRMEYGAWTKEHWFYIRLCEKPVLSDSNYTQSLTKELVEEEKESRKESQFVLPAFWEQQPLQWRLKSHSSVPVLGALFLLLLPLLSWEKDREVHRLAQKRKEALKDRYSEFVCKLNLLLEAGMNTKGAFFRMAAEYQKKKEKGRPSDYLYEEILYICRQMNNGLSEKEGYELLGKRCGLASYKKLTSLLVQHLQKGGAGMTDMLRKEVERANEERKALVKRKGEEAGTKLLFPMMIMLGIVMLLIIVPAWFSFQIQ